MSEPLAQLAPLTLLLGLLVLSWDILLAGWMAARREAPRAFTQLTSLCGLLVAPALVVAIATGTEAGARTVSGISWLLPAVCAAFVLQVLYAIVAGLVSPVVAIPILLYDLVVTVVVTGDYLVATQGSAPLPLQAAVAARDVVFGMTIGRASLVSPFTMIAPMIAPAYPARWRLSAIARATLVLSATAVTTVLLIEWPRGVAAVRSYESVRSEPMQARPLDDFAMGMRFLPVLGGPPPTRAVRADRALVDSFEPDVILVVLDAEGTRNNALDSLARVLEPLRVDSTKIAVALNLSRHAARADDPARASAIERVLLKLRPDVLFPAMSEPLPSVLPSEVPSISWWREVLRVADVVRTRVRPATSIGVPLTRLDARDSALYAWAQRPSTGVGVVGAVVFPSFSGLPGVDARLRAFERWHARANATSRHWLVNVGGLPHAHGDASQLAAMRHTFAWGSRRAWITAVIAGEPADYVGAVGIRAANGRVRATWPVLSQAAKAMRDVRTR
jgi:hypothetical protein